MVLQEIKKNNICTLKKLLIRQIKKTNELINRPTVTCRQSITEKFKTASTVTSILLFHTDVEWDDCHPLITRLRPWVN